MIEINMFSDSLTESVVQAARIVITGRVQGVGFRPFVNRLANGLGLSGWVRNCNGQVEIHAEGSAEALTAFVSDLKLKAPPLAQPEAIHMLAQEPEGLAGFVILGSGLNPTDWRTNRGLHAGSVNKTSDLTHNHIPPDYFVCGDCLAELQDPKQRRYRYPFINCTQCGPRYTLIERLPYDRPNTAMAGFTLCQACLAEYSNPLDRRFHAQPLACGQCGPRLLFRQPGAADVTGDEAVLSACLSALSVGLVVAVKGIGGYHLLCDASQKETVGRLRSRKNRPDKPLAVLVPWRGDDGLALAALVAELDETERDGLRSPLRPIVLVKKQDNACLADNIASSLAEVGLMLPYSPLHHLLADGYGAPLVATSANISGEPVLTDAEAVETRLSTVADAFLHHDRPIRRPADDSVYRRIAGKLRPVRIGRGGAPIERKLSFEFSQPLLAVGADLKNTIALGFGDRMAVSPHIGDLGSLRGQQVFEQVITDLQQLYDVEPAAVVCDAHPGFHSRQWAEQSGLPVVPVLHHHAHASALVGEHSLDATCLVFAWDGTGYGEDGSIWGGETLLGRPGGWRRVGSLKPFYLPGGDQASRQPWRCALAVCWELGQDWPDCPEGCRLLHTAWQRKLNCPKTSSVGRLFDAAAALTGIATHASYEGHAAMRLEACSHATETIIPLPVSSNSQGLLLTDWGPLIRFLSDTAIDGKERASVFHASLATAIVEQALSHRKQNNLNMVGLTGGVFQNRLLTELAVNGLERQGFTVILHGDIPAGDGGISFGQLVEAGAKT